MKNVLQVPKTNNAPAVMRVREQPATITQSLEFYVIKSKKKKNVWYNNFYFLRITIFLSEQNNLLQVYYNLLLSNSQTLVLFKMNN